MRKAKVIYKDEEAGILTQEDDGSFKFRYHPIWLSNREKPSVSLTLPKQEEAFTSEYLFPFFFNMLPEGSNKKTVCFQARIDESDNFGLLLTTAKHDTIGAVRIEKMEAV